MKKKKGMDRRSFFMTSAIGLAGLGTGLKASTEPLGRQSAVETPRIKRYRILGRTGFKASDIGIGTSRVAIVPLINAALDAGVNYIDTAENYGRGSAEANIGEAIKSRDRKSLFITTKIQTGSTVGKDQVMEKVRQCLQRLQTDYVDCLMSQGMSTSEALKEDNFHQAAEQLKKEGKVRFIGISNHGSRAPGQGEPMEKILLAAVDDGRFDLLLLVYNFLQKEAGEQVLEAAAKKNIATTIMKSDPLGRYFETKERLEQMKKAGETPDENMLRYLAQMEETSKKAESFLQKYDLKTSGQIKTAALKFVLANPGVHVLNLAFNSFEDVQNFLKLSGTGLEPAEKKMLSAYEKECGQLYCRHACGICEAKCPHQVPVNRIMRYFHYFDAHGAERFAMEKYAKLETANAGQCRDCAGFCARHCPYGVPIQGLLHFAHTRLTLT